MTRRMLDTKAAAERIGLAPATLETKRSRGGGPPYLKLGAKVVYSEEELERWLAARRRTSTADDRARQPRPTRKSRSA